MPGPGQQPLHHLAIGRRALSADATRACLWRYLGPRRTSPEARGRPPKRPAGPNEPLEAFLNRVTTEARPMRPGGGVIAFLD
jgi:hypothetical protein